MSPRLMIGIAGGSCSGKGHLTRYIHEKGLSSNSSILLMDAYYRDLSHLPSNKRNVVNFDTPEALDRRLLTEHLTALSAGETVDVPTYDFATHTRSARSEVTISDASVILVEGIFALYWQEIRQFFSAKIYIDLDIETCLERRIERDVRERGRTPESVKRQFRETVLPMHERYVAPTRFHANLVLQGDAPVEESGARVLDMIAREGAV